MDGIRKYFIKVKGKFDGIGYDEVYVPTREEYKDFGERGCYYTDELTKRIEALEFKSKKDDEELELELSPTIIIQKDGLECTIELEDHKFKFEFEQPISHIAQLVKDEDKEIPKKRIAGKTITYPACKEEK